MITVKESILTYLLDCGTADLEMLEDIDYDIDDIIEELQESNALSLHDIFRVVFRKAGEDLAEALKEQKDDIRSRIEYALEAEQKEYLETGEMTEEELEECEEHISLVNDLKLLDGGELSCTQLNTSVSMAEYELAILAAVKEYFKECETMEVYVEAYT